MSYIALVIPAFFTPETKITEIVNNYIKHNVKNPHFSQALKTFYSLLYSLPPFHLQYLQTP